MTLPFIVVEYEENLKSVTWQGLRLCDGEELSSFMREEVADRLKDTPERDEFHNHLQGLALTGMGEESLKEVLSKEIPEERPWAVGEALAEALLIRRHRVVFPWNMERDKRNAKSNLSGADIVGFLPINSGFRLVLGEVKTSSEEKYPPQVMFGRSGLSHQIDNLAKDMSKIYQLIKWLYSRCKGTRYEKAYNQSLTFYLNTGNKAVSLFGILIRDTGPNVLDLERRGQTLCHTVVHPTSCELIAVYLPCKIVDLPGQVEGGDAA